jgi:hypothetical protein
MFYLFIGTPAAAGRRQERIKKIYIDEVGLKPCLFYFFFPRLCLEQTGEGGGN